MDDILDRLARLESSEAALRRGMAVLDGDYVRRRRETSDADASRLEARLAPGHLGSLGARGARWDPLPSLGAPLLQRLRDDGALSVSGGRTDTTAGYANLLYDPTFDTVPSAPTTIGTAYTALGPEWEAKYVLNSGTVATTRAMDQFAPRGDPVYSPNSSGVVVLNLVFGTDASDMTVYLRPFLEYTPNLAAVPSWITASVLSEVNSLSNVTATAYLEIVDATDAVLASGDPEDLANLFDIEERSSLAVGLVDPVSAGDYRFRLRIDVTKTAGSAGSTEILLAEPLLAFSDDGSAPMFTPAVGAWWPGAPGRQLVKVEFLEANLPAGATTQLDPSDMTFGNARPPQPWGGSVVGLSWVFNNAVTAGTYDVDALVNGSAVFVSNGNTATSGYATQGPFIDTFDPGATIGVQITTGGGFLPVTLEVIVYVWLLIDYPGT